MHLCQVKVQPSSHCAGRPSHNSVGKKYAIAKIYLKEEKERPVTVPEGRKAIVIPSGILECETHGIIDRYRLISMGCVSSTPMGYVIKGVLPTDWTYEPVYAQWKWDSST